NCGSTSANPGRMHRLDASRLHSGSTSSPCRSTLAQRQVHKPCSLRSESKSGKCPDNKHRGGPVMARAIWNNAVLAESEKTVVVEGNHYFPPESLHKEFFKPSSTHTTCSWKGIASYYDITVNGVVNRNAAWYYATPLEAAKHIAGYIAFWKGVKTQ